MFLISGPVLYCVFMSVRVSTFYFTVVARSVKTEHHGKMDIRYVKVFPLYFGLELIEFRCVVTVSTPAVWLARENIKRLTPRPCINVEYSHGVVYMEESL